MLTEKRATQGLGAMKHGLRAACLLDIRSVMRAAVAMSINDDTKERLCQRDPSEEGPCRVPARSRWACARAHVPFKSPRGSRRGVRRHPPRRGQWVTRPLKCVQRERYSRQTKK